MNATISYTGARQNLKSICDKVCNEKIPILIERRVGDNVVIISEEDFSSLEEIAYLFRSPKNATRLLESLNAPKSERISFDNIKELKNALGI